MAGPNLPTDVGTGTTAGHFAHSNTANGLINKLDTTIGAATSGQVLSWDAGTGTYKPAAASVGSGASTGSANTFTAHQRFTSGVPHVDVSSSVDATGATDAGPALQTMIDTAPTGAKFNFPPNSKYRISTTVKVLGSRSQIHMEGVGPRSYNEADSGVRGPLLIADAGVTPFQFGDDTPSGVTYRGPLVRNITIREASDTKTAVGFDVRGVVNWAFENVNVRGFATAIKVDCGGQDASWGSIVNPMIYKCNRGVWALGADFAASEGNYSVDGWAFYLEPKATLQTVAKLTDCKIDGTGTGIVGGGVYSEAALLESKGVQMEFSTTNGQTGYKFVRDAVKHANSGKFNRVLGGSITGRSPSTSHVGIDIGTGCDETEIWGTKPNNLTTKITGDLSRARYAFAGEGVTSARAYASAHYSFLDAAGAALTSIAANSATVMRWTIDKAASTLQVKLAGTTSSDRFTVSDGTNDLLRVQGDGMVSLTGYEQFTEQGADPAAPSTNNARLFARDNGAGKTQLCVRFATGAVQVLSTEP